MSAEAIKALSERERANWDAMPFLAQGKKAGKHPFWSPARAHFETAERGGKYRQWDTDHQIGKYYAMAMIHYLREFGGAEGFDDLGGRLADVAEAMAKARKFGTVEKAFWQTIGDFIAGGSVYVGGGFVATRREPLQDEAKAERFNRLRAAAATLDALKSACPGDGTLADALHTVMLSILVATDELENGGAS